MKKFSALLLISVLAFSVACSTVSVEESSNEIYESKSQSATISQQTEESDSIVDISEKSLSEQSSDSSYEDSEEEVYFTVTAVKNNGQADYVTQVKKGQNVELEEPTFGDKVFLGWFVQGEYFDATEPILSDVTVYAEWGNPLTKTLTKYSGTFTQDGGTITCSQAGIMANCTDNLKYGTIEVNVNASVRSDNGIIFGLETNNRTSFWEEGVSYYFFFVSQSGFAYLGKVNNGWTHLKSLKISGYALGNTYKLKVVIDGTDIKCMVNDKLYLTFSEQIGFLSGGGYGIRAGADGVTFSGFNVSR